MAYGFKSRLSHQNYVPDFAIGHIFYCLPKTTRCVNAELKMQENAEEIM